MTQAAEPVPAPVHPHGNACYWDVFECRWSCEAPRRVAPPMSGESASSTVHNVPGSPVS